MPLSLPHYAVYLADPDDPDDLDKAVRHEVRILTGDQLRAELEGGKNLIPGMDKAPMHGVILWVWAALTRTKVIAQPFQQFVTRVLSFEDLDEQDGIDGQPAPVVPVGESPTPEEAATGPLSSSSTSSPAPTGEIPSSTPV